METLQQRKAAVKVKNSDRWQLISRIAALCNGRIFLFCVLHCALLCYKREPLQFRQALQYFLSKPVYVPLPAHFVVRICAVEAGAAR